VRHGAIAAAAAIALVLGSCGHGELPPALSNDLQDQVASIRRAAETGQRGTALRRLEALVGTVNSLLDGGRIDEGRGLAILQSAEAVGNQLALLPPPSPTVTSSPSPVQEEGYGGDGKGKDEGHGHEGHGKDD
jgi:hypothetical protein